jgi:hypothetical protein
VTRARPLRAVAPGEAPAGPPKTVTEAANSGTTRELLVAMRTRIASVVENEKTQARDLAALTKRLVEVVRDIEAIDAREQQEAANGGPAADEKWSAV